MNVKSITVALLVTFLAATRAGADEPPPWLHAPDPQRAAGADMYSGGLLLSAGGGVLVVAFFALLAAHVVDELTPWSCPPVLPATEPAPCIEPDRTWHERDTAIGLLAAGVGSLGIGLPLAILGHQKMSRAARHAAELHVTPTSLAVRVRF